MPCIKPYITNEYDHLSKVVMCLANPFDLDFSNLPADLVDEAAIFQMERNPHRPYDVEKVHSQQRDLIDVLEKNGAQVLLAEPLGSGVAQHYTRDVGFTIHDIFFIARPRRTYRRRELQGFEPVALQIENAYSVSEGFIEGGDVFVDNDVVIIGRGEETDDRGIDFVEKVIHDRGLSLHIKRLTFTHRGAIHTDVYFNIVGPHLAMIHRPSFIEEDVAWLEDRFDLIDVTEQEATTLQTNTLAIGNGRIVMLAPGGSLADRLSNHGLAPILIDYSEVTAMPGSFRCTTLPVIRR